jgi:hypothetical protein
LAHYHNPCLTDPFNAKIDTEHMDLQIHSRRAVFIALLAVAGAAVTFSIVPSDGTGAVLMAGAWGSLLVMGLVGAWLRI